MKDAHRQGRRDALALKPRFKPSYWLDADRYNKGYDEGLAALQVNEEIAAEAAILKNSDNTGRVFKHVKTGKLYRFICSAIHESSGAQYVVYESMTGLGTWLRPSEEFFDGRFEEVV